MLVPISGLEPGTPDPDSYRDGTLNQEPGTLHVTH